ncbi:P-loop containing nucleoside triphosphate hydrolase protein [Corynespora cassiicola Philippines]|uniref:P-loop containing nucleoside triphosphate hydrolase protein n=1 Tax=Corynespora cassiicola Philippines TaxID=1448308 RepID=A0A2T2NUI8_CORCC|nr:P-loop containing nucleoside triphosphate hydrolase protein [Corynespora cassiicola Philippines]
MVECPLCFKPVKDTRINEHIDSGCTEHVLSQHNDTPAASKTHSFFTPAAAARKIAITPKNANPASSPPAPSSAPPNADRHRTPPPPLKRSLGDTEDGRPTEPGSPSTKRKKLSALQEVAPLAERMRPTSLDDVYGQDLVGPNGLLRGMVEEGKIPSMILWGRPGTGKTTIARLVANMSNARYVEINSTSSGVGDLKKIFSDAAKDLLLTKRRTIVFCDELHRFNKSQQDHFLGPVEAGQITLIAATTENPSFKVINALISRCRVFTLESLKDDDLVRILQRAMEAENCTSPLLDQDMLKYFAAFSDGDARTALNLLDLAMNMAQKRPSITAEDLKKSLTKTLVYDRNGDQHYESISALHKSIRGSDPDAALYYLGRMLESGEDPLYIARRLIVVASEDVGLADNTMLPLATAAYSACEKIGMPECRINLAHAVVALSLAPKSTRSYRGLANVMAALKEPGVASLPIPMHLRNAPTRMMKDMGYGAEYKYNPDYVDGRAKQDYLPEQLLGRQFLEDKDFGDKIDDDIEEDLESPSPKYGDYGD